MGLREVACAAKMRDWDAIDAALEDMRLAGNEAVMRGFTDARKTKGEVSLPPLAKPDPVTINDLSPEDRARAEIHGKEGWPKTFTLSSKAA